MSGRPVIEARGVTKRFPGVTALDAVDFTLRRGEVHALLGENGAGKSTLTRIIAGDYPPDEGGLLMAGEPVRFSSPRDARQAGIRLVTQERALVPSLSVAENVFLGRLPARSALGPVDWRALRRRAEGELARVGLAVDPGTEVGRLRPAEQQLVEIAKALSEEGSVLILDEPTAALSSDETARLFGVVRALRADGAAVLYISHRVGELHEIADRVTVLRDGRVVGTHRAGATTSERLVREMVGRDLVDLYPRERREPGEVLLEMIDVDAPGVCEGLSLTVRAGEIVAAFGLVGSGATELPYVAAGDLAATGSVRRHARPGLVPVDRRSEGLLAGSSVRRNIGVASLRRYRRGAVALSRRAERRAAQARVADLDLRPARVETRVATLSGGNQQKAVLGRWLEAEADLLLLSEPTRGVDVGARAEIYRILARRAAGGAAVLMASSDLDEVVGLADRVYVVSRGRVAAELAGPAITPEAVLEAATR